MQLAKNLLLLLLATVAGFLGAQLGGQKETTDTSIKYRDVIASGVIRCGYGVSPPILAKDPNTGVVSGLDAEIWQAIGQQLGLKIDWAEEAGWGNFIEGLDSGRYDAFCSQHWPDPSRSKHLTTSDPVIYSFLDGYARADDARFDGNLARVDQPDVVIPVIDGDISIMMSETRFPRSKMLVLPQTATVSEMLMSIVSKKADLMFMDQAMAKALLDANPGSLRKIPGLERVYTFAGHYGFKQGDTVLRDMVNLALRRLVDDGTVARLATKYSTDYGIPALGYQQK